MFPLYYMHSDVLSIFNYFTTLWCYYYHLIISYIIVILYLNPSYKACLCRCDCGFKSIWSLSSYFYDVSLPDSNLMEKLFNQFYLFSMFSGLSADREALHITMANYWAQRRRVPVCATLCKHVFIHFVMNLKLLLRIYNKVNTTMLYPMWIWPFCNG